MSVRRTAIAGLVVGGLMAGISATPATAAPARVVSASAAAGTSSSAGSLRLLTLASAEVGVGVGPVVPGAPALPPETSPRYLPVLLAMGRAFIAAVKVVPRAYVKMRPAIIRGISALGTFVKKEAPGAARTIVAGVGTAALWDILKKVLGL